MNISVGCDQMHLRRQHAACRSISHLATLIQASPPSARRSTRTFCSKVQYAQPLRRIHRCRISCSAGASNSPTDEPHPVEASTPTKPSTVYILGLIAAVTVFGVTNRVLYKVALVPLRNYVFFLAQLQNVGYLLVYFGVLAWRYRTGKVTNAMLAAPKRPFLLIGACEALAQVLFMVGASRLPGALLPVLGQTYLIWNLAFASLILGTRYSKSQIGGAALVMVGVALAALPANVPAGAALTGGAAAAVPLDLFSVGLCVVCFAFPALANIVKEALFTSQRKRLGQPLDIFVVNSYGSAAQAVFVVLLLPVTTYLSGIPLSGLGQYLANGLTCFLGGSPACGSVCTGAPELPVAYVLANLAFNISVLTLLRTVGSVATTILTSCVVPLQILAFVVLPLPYLEAAVLSANFWWGAGALLLGLLTYNYHAWQPYVQRWLGPDTPGNVACREDLPQP